MANGERRTENGRQPALWGKVRLSTAVSIESYCDLGFSTQQEVDGLLKQTQIPGKKILNLERSLERHRSK